MKIDGKNKENTAKEFYIETNGERIQVTEEVYRAFYRPVWTENKREGRNRRCRLPNGVRCTQKCSECTKMKDGSNLSLDSLSEDAGFEPQSDYDAAAIYEKQELLEQLHKVLDELEDIDRNIVKLKFFEGMSEREIATVVGFKSHKSVSKRLKKALAELKEKLKDFF